MSTATPPRAAKPPRIKADTRITMNATPRAWAGTTVAGHTPVEVQIALACLNALPEAQRPFWSLARVAFIQVSQELARRPLTPLV